TIVAGGGAAGLDARLEASDDGQSFHPAAAIPNSRASERTISFAPVTAKYFRVSFPAQVSPTGAAPQSSSAPISIAELELHPGARVNHFEEKAAFRQMPDLNGFATPEVAASDA